MRFRRHPGALLDLCFSAITLGGPAEARRPMLLRFRRRPGTLLDLRFVQRWGWIQPLMIYWRDLSTATTPYDDIVRRPIIALGLSQVEHPQIG